MKKTSNFDRLIRVHLSLALMLILKSNTTAQQLSQDPLYELVFHDEFDSLGLDTSKWLWRWENGQNLFNATKIIGCNDPNTSSPIDSMDLGYNSDVIDDTNNVSFDTTGGGFRRLISKKETTPIQGQIWQYDSIGFTGVTFAPFNYTTAMLKSKYFFRYGYFEIRFRTSNPSNPLNNAYGPNFWMFGGGKADSIAAYSEIDIYEMNSRAWTWKPNTLFRHKNINDPNALNLPYDTSRYIAYSNNALLTPPPAYSNNDYIVPNLNGWKTAGCEWTSDYTDFYYDSNDTLRRYSNTKVHVGAMTEMSMIVDCYFPSNQYCLFANSSTVSPFNYDIDYVRVYQIKQDCTNKNFLITSSSSFLSKLYQSLVIGGIGGSAIFNNGIHHLAAQDYVLLDSGFEASGFGTTIIIDTRNCQNGQSITHHFPLSNNQVWDEKLINDLKKSKKNE